MLAEDTQVPGDGGLADREMRVQLCDVVGALRKQLDDAAAGRIGECRKRVHMQVYSTTVIEVGSR